MDPSDNFTEVLTIHRQTSHTTAGDPVRGTTITTMAKIERGRGEQVSTGGRLDYSSFLMTASEVQLGDLLFFPEDDPNNDDTGKRPIRVEAIRDLDGDVTHFEVYL